MNWSGIFTGKKRVLLFMFLSLASFAGLVLFRSVPVGASMVHQSAETVALQANQSPASPVGDAGKGRDLFMGDLHFQNGSPPCMGCHNVGSNGILGGGALGPDLTNVTTRRSQSELDAILSNTGIVPAPVMQPIFAEHPLTEEEQVDLLAFLAASVGQPETNREWLVIGISILGLLVSIGLIELVYHRRLHGVRKPMIRNAYPNKP